MLFIQCLAKRMYVCCSKFSDQRMHSQPNHDISFIPQPFEEQVNMLFQQCRIINHIGKPFDHL